MLVSLLSCPFRSERSDSVWYNNPAEADLAAWDALLETTVLRFRAKRVGSNFGVLETVAAHLEDFTAVSDDEKATNRRLTSPTTQRCLAVASSKVSFVPTEHYHASHFSITENYVPVDFLGFVSSVLDASYSSAEPSAVARLIGTFSDVFRGLPADSVADVLEPIRASLVKWMTDESKMATGDLVHQLDNLYIAVLGAITLAIENGSMPASSATMNDLIDVYAPRLSCAQSAAVPAAFQDFWRRSFQPVSGLKYSDDVAGFLHDVLTAVPGLIIVEGLYSDESQQSCASDRFPFADSVPSQIVERAAPEEDIVPETQSSHGEYEEEADEAVDLSLDHAPSPVLQANLSTDPSADYDADVSQSQPKRKRKNDVLIDSSPSTKGSPDVFGPKKRTKIKKNSRPSRSKALRSRASSPQVGNDTVIPGTDDEDEPTPTRPSREAMRREPPPRESLFGRLIRRVPSIGSFWTEPPASYELEDTDVDEDDQEPAGSDGFDANEELAEVGNNTYDEESNETHREALVEETPEEPVRPAKVAAPEIVVSMEAEPTPAPPKAPSARVTRRQSKQSTPSLEPTQVNTQTDSQPESHSRRRSRRVANQPPLEVASHSRKASIEPAVESAQLEVQPAPPKAVARLRSELAADAPATQPEESQSQSQRSTRSSARRKRGSDTVEETPAKRVKRLRSSVSAPVATETKDARSLRRERRQRASNSASVEPRSIETPVRAAMVEPEPQVEEVKEPQAEEPIEVEHVAEPEEPVELVEPVESVEPVEPEAAAEPVEPEAVVEPLQVDEPAEEPEPEVAHEDKEPIDIDISAVAEDLVQHLAPAEPEPANCSEAIPSAFQDAPSAFQNAPSAFEDALEALDRSEAIPSAFQDAPTPAPPAKAVPVPAPADDDDEEDEAEVERITAQTRLLATLDTLTCDEALNNLDLSGAHAVLGYARQLQDAATATLAAFAREGEASRLRRTRTL